MHIGQFGHVMQAQLRLCEHFDTRPNNEVSLLVIHCISLPEGEYGTGYIDDLFAGKIDTQAHPSFASLKGLNVSAHCVITREGQLHQYVPFAKRAWHAGVSSFEGRERCNDFSIGIELEGTDKTPYTDAQYATLSTLSKAIVQRYPAITQERIVGHSDIAPGRKTDPGIHFDWARYLRLTFAPN